MHAAGAVDHRMFWMGLDTHTTVAIRDARRSSW